MGNCKVERAKLPPGFIPMGMKEYGGIIYIASYNPDTKECEVGSFPSPERDITGSNKIGNQTGLQDGKFLTTDYSIPITRVGEEFNPELLRSKLQKLNEESVLMLNPGDKFITTFQVNPTSGSGDPVTEVNFQDYFSNSNLNKKLFQITFYKIDSSNNVVKIPNNEIRTIKHTNPIDEDQYVYYTENSSGSIAVGIEMNTLPYFSSSVRETSKLKDEAKTLNITAIGESDSSMDFKGMRVDLTKNETETKTFHVENQGITDTIAVNVEGFAQDDEVKCDVTPYSKYGYLSDLLQSFSLKMGQSITGSQVNNIFKWYVNTTSNRLELDFDFLLETENTFKLFLEFYDPWSNVSTIRNIPSPSVYGPMRFVMNLVREDRTTIFDPYPNNPPIDASNQKGGISFSKLMLSENSVMVPALIDPAKSENKLLIRSDNALRKDHFYIVRLCGYEEELDENNNPVRTYYDAYRALYTSDIFNDLYVEQSNVDPSSDSYRPIFSDESFPIEKIKYAINKDGVSAPMTFKEVAVDVLPNDTLLPKTEVAGNKQLFNVNAAPPMTDIGLKINTKWEGERVYNVVLSKPNQYIYGDLKPNLLTVKTPAGDIQIDPNKIEEDNHIVTGVDLRKDTKAFLNLPNLNDGNNRPRLKLRVDTNRPIYSPYVRSLGTGQIEDVYLGSLLHYPREIVHGFCAGNMVGTHSLYRTDFDGRRECSYEKYGTTLRIMNRETTTSPKDGFALKSINQGKEDNELLAPTMLRDTNKNFFVISHGARMDSLSDNNALYMRDGTSNRMVAFRIQSLRSGGFRPISDSKAFLDMFYFKRMSDTPANRYHLSDAIVSYSVNDLSKLTEMTVEIKSGWSTVSSKTYIFSSYFHALSGNMDFSTANINSLIAAAKARMPNNVVVDGAEEISDTSNFIPSLLPAVVLEDSIFILKLEDERIGLEGNRQMQSLFAQSKPAFENYIANIPDDTNDLRPVFTNRTTESRLVQYAKYFSYDPVTKNLVINRPEFNNTTPQYSNNYDGGSKTGYMRFAELAPYVIQDFT